jgi:hypothetical protein
MSGLESGRRTLTVRRIDREHSWSSQKLELIPTEKREVDLRETFSFQLYCPADSVALVELGKGA